MKRFTKNLLLAVGLLSCSIVTGNAMAPRPALIQAVWDGDVATVQNLLAAGADINQRDGGNGRTALMIAALTGSGEILDILLERGADATLFDNENQTALIFAAGFHDAEIAFNMTHSLLDTGASATINAQNNFGETALMRATAHRNVNVVRLLLLHRADALLRNEIGEVVFDIAEGNGYEELNRLLVLGSKTAIRSLVLSEWPELPREVLEAEIMSYL